MTEPNHKIRREVMAEIIKVYATADEAGLDGWKVCKAKFPGIPDEVLAEAMCEVDNRKTERWWESVEKTIDGEVIRNAIAKAGEEQRHAALPKPLAAILPPGGPNYLNPSTAAEGSPWLSASSSSTRTPTSWPATRPNSRVAPR